MSSPSVPSSVSPSAREWLLVVDDDQPIRTLVAHQLEMTGAEVVQAESAAAALRILDEITPAPFLILIDVLMPGMDGLTLARRLQGRFRDKTKIAIISGHMNDGSWWPVELRELPFIAKPYHRDELLALVAQARAERSSRGG